jgi:YidC/Oxa1 family membrane protein insertase
MDSFRTIAGIVFAVSLFLLVQAWMKDHQPPPAAPAAATQPTPSSTPVPTTPTAATPSTPAAAPVKPAQRVEGEKVVVTTDIMKVEINTAGGDIRRVELLKYRDTLDSTKNFVLLEDDAQHVYVAQSGLIGADLPDHRSVYTATASAFDLGSDQKDLTVRLETSTPSGVKVGKVFTFHRGSYVVDIAFQVSNATPATIAPVAYYQLVRDTKPAAGDSKMVPSFLGAAVFTDKDKLRKSSLEDVIKGKAEYPKQAQDGWVAIIQHYFLGAWIPEPGRARDNFVQAEQGLVAAGVKMPVGSIGNGETKSVSAQLYAGPQEQTTLSKLAPGFEFAVDYGYFRPLAVPLFWVLSQIHDLVHNWGVAIILLTVMIKLAFYPLSAASYKSMARMKVLAPKLQRLKERYGDDRQKMHQAMMELYKTEKVNPLGGCLPIVVQIPVFIALYWVLLSSVELRQAPFMLWIHDLSLQDPYYILPVLMGATMFIQTWLNPAPPDPVQAKMMKIMPVAFSVFFFFFPAGLVLYWLVNNVLSIAQQWYITRSLEQAKASRGDN